MKLLKKNIYIIGNSPQVDWQRIFIAAFLLAIFVSGYGFFFYNKISSQSADSESPVTINENFAVKEVATSTEAIAKPVDRKNLELNQVIELYLHKKALYQQMLDALKKT